LLGANPPLLATVLAGAGIAAAYQGVSNWIKRNWIYDPAGIDLEN